jgi:transcriptional regulator with XRE-family HTH domain
MKRGTQSEISRQIAVNRSYICDILARRTFPSRKTAIRLEEKTGIPAADWLFASRERLRELLDEKFPG